MSNTKIDNILNFLENKYHNKSDVVCRTHYNTQARKYMLDSKSDINNFIYKNVKYSIIRNTTTFTWTLFITIPFSPTEEKLKELHIKSYAIVHGKCRIHVEYTSDTDFIPTLVKETYESILDREYKTLEYVDKHAKTIIKKLKKMS